MASLHQAVAEHLPSRAEFYAPWLHSESLRTPRVSVAGIRAALSFLRLEDSAYDRVVRRAGSLAAEWTWQRLSGLRRAWLRALPVPLRARAACRLVRDVATEAWEDTRVTVRWRRGVGRLTIGPSLFCSVRSQVPDSLCGFYAAALDTYLRELDVECEVRIGQCAACGDGPCGITVTPVRRGRTSIGAAVALAVLLGGPAVARAESTQSVQSAGRSERPIVMPFENPSKDPAAAWLGEGAAILVTEWLVRAGVAAFTRDERIQAFDRLEVPPLAALSRATVLRVGLLVGASDVIVGSIRADGDVLVATASRIRLDRGVRDPEVTVSGRKDDLADVFRRVAAGLFAGGLAPPPAPGRALVPAAFELHVKGLLANTMSAQVTLLQSALKADPAYEAPRLALWHVFTANGDHAAAREALRAVAQDSPRRTEAQFLITVSLVHLGQFTEATALLKSLHAAEPAA